MQMRAKKSGHRISTTQATVIVFSSWLLLCNTANAESLNPEQLLNQYKKLLAQQQKEFETQREIIANQGKELEQLKQRLDAFTSQTSEGKQPATKPAARVIAQATTEQPKPQPPQMPIKPVGQAPAETTEKVRPPEIPRLSETVGGVLTRKGKIAIEPAFEYGYTDNDRVFLDAFTFLPAIAVGLIDLRQIKRHTMMASVAARYGVTDRLELELRAPYIYRTDTQRSRPISIGAGVDETFSASGMALGDIEFAGRYQLTSGQKGWPILVGNMVASVPSGVSPFDIEYVAAQGVPGATFPTELPTGAGYFSFQPSITALYPTDPAVFFSNFSYNYNMETDETVGNYDPGNAIGLSFGMGFGLNERSSFSLGYSHRHVFNSTLNAITIKGSELDIGQLLIGYSYKLSPKTTYNLALGIGTTEDAQDVRLNFRMPWTFDLGSK